MDKIKIDAALKKITEEAAQLKNYDVCKVLIAEYLESRIKSDRIADLILKDDKKLSDLNKLMDDEAKKRYKEAKAPGGEPFHFPDTELMAMADEYYGITGPDSSDNIIDISDLL